MGGKMLVSLDLTAAAPPAFTPPAAHWRGVRPLEGNEIYYGGAAPATAVALPRAHRAVRVEFAAPELRVHIGGKTGIEYRTRAASLDRGWSSWSAASTRELTNLPAGEQKLEVQARNHLGAIGPAASLVLIVPPFWWETWWWRTCIALAGAGVIAGVVRGLVRRQFQQRIALLEAQAAVQNERLRIARDMHDDLGSTLASIVHLSSPEAAEPGRPPDGTLPRVHEAARELVQRTRDIVWAATPQHDSLESLIEQLTAHAERTLGDRGVAVRAETSARVPDAPIGAAARHGLFLAFKEAVNNTAKHAHAHAATVRIELTADAIIVTLADDGVGFAENELGHPGNGLGNLRSRLQALGGSADIASAPGRGTTVTLRLPRTR
jgi:signal transduction histidine kinase